MCPRIRLLAAALVATALLSAPAMAQTSGGVLAPWTQVGPVPGGRLAAPMAYDASRGLVVLFGGSISDSDINDTWTFDGHVWKQITSAAGPPAGDSLPVAYDPLIPAVVIVDTNGATWSFDGATWHQIAAFGSGQFGAQMAFDPALGKIVLLAVDGSTWAFNGATWTQLTPTANPGPRSNEGLVYDAHLGRIVLFGGVDQFGGALSDTWTFDGVTWTQLALSVSPSPRQYATMVYDPIHGRSLLFGGTPSGLGSSLSDTWSFDGAAWTQLSPILGPKPREAAPGAFVPAIGQVVLFGGYQNDGQTPSDTWAFDGASWVQIGMPPTFFGTAPDPSSGLLLGAGTDGTTWLWDGSTWLQRPVAALPYSTNSALGTDATRGRVVLLDSSGTTFTWDGAAWTQLTPIASPPIRSSTSMAWDPVRHLVVLFGGADTFGQALSDTWTWDGVNWAQVAPALSPPGRYAAGMAWDPATTSVLLLGGFGTSGVSLGDIWHWDGVNWTADPATLPASGRAAVALDTDIGQPVLIDSAAHAWSWNGTQWNGQTNAIGLTQGSIAFATATHQLVDASSTTWFSSGAVGNIVVNLTKPVLSADGIDSTTATAQITDTGGHPAPGLPVRFEASGSQPVGAITDHGDGSYSASLTSTLDVGSFVLVVRALVVTGQAAFSQSGQQLGIGISPGSLDFGTTGLGITTQALVVTVTSTGTGPVSMGASTLSGANPGDFHIVSDGCGVAAVLASGATCQVSLTFTPTMPGARGATLQINDTAPGSPQSVSLTGGGASLTLSPATIDFGSVTQGVATPPATVTVANNSPNPVTITSISFTGANASDFKTTADACTGIAVTGSGTCGFGVIFTPQGPGARSATLSVASASPDSPATMSVTGTGVALAAAAALDPPNFSFASVAVGSSSLAATFTLTSTGNIPLSVTSVSLGGNQPQDFTIAADGCSGANMAPGQSCTVSVTFSPKQVCASSATLSIVGTAGTQGAALSGLAIAGVTGPFQSVLYCTSYGAAPQDLAAGMDGNVWFDELGSRFAPPAVATVSAANGVQEYSSKVSPGWAPYEFTFAPDGSYAWVEASGGGYPAYLKVISAAGVQTTYPLPGQNPSVGPLGVGPDGAFWYASNYSCGDSPLVTRYVPGAAPVSYTPSFVWLATNLSTPGQYWSCAQTSTVTTGPDGTVWIGTTNNVAIPINGSPTGFIRVTTDGVFLDFTPTYPNGYPSAATLGSDGNLYALLGGNTCQGLERFTAAGVMTPVPLGSSAFIQSCNALTSGPDGLLWLIGGVFNGSSIVRSMVSVDPIGGGVNAYPAPASQYLTSGPDEGIWFNSLPSAVGRFNIGGKPARAFVSPSLVGFPSTDPGIQSGVRTVTVHSSGTGPLTVSGVSLGGADPGQFLITGDFCSGAVLPPGATCSVNLVSRPTVAGSHSATLVVADDDAFAPQVVKLAEYTIPPQPQPVPTSVAFPATLVGQHTATTTVTLKNPGDRPLSVTSVSLGGTNPGDFAIVADQCSGTSVPIGGSCTVTVRFAPTLAGTRTATLVFRDKSISITQTVALQGGGQASSGSGGTCQCSSTGPFLDPVVVDPVAAPTSPNGLFNLSVTTPTGALQFTITNASGATVMSFSAPGDATWPVVSPWGFSPDGNRFVIHYASQGLDNIQLYDLTKAQPNNLVFLHSLPMNPGGSAPSPNGSVGFSPGGEYLAATQIQSPGLFTPTVSLYVVPATGAGTQTPAPLDTWSPVVPPGDTDAVVGSSYWGFSPDGQSFTFIKLDANANPTEKLVALPSQTVVQQRTFVDGSSFWIQYAPCGEVMALITPDPANPGSRVDITLYSTAAADAGKPGVPNTPSTDLPAGDRQIEAGPANYTATFTGWSNIVTLGPNLTSGGVCAPPTANSPGGGSSVPSATNSARFDFTGPVPLVAYEGIKYSFDFTATGATPLLYGLTGQPPAWLTIDPNGTVSGTPPVGTGQFSYSVGVSNSTGNDQVGPFTVIVRTPTPPSFTADAPPTSATVGQAYSYTFKASGTPAPTFALEAGAPTWLSIDADTGAMTGTPPSSILSFSFSVTASNGAAPDATVGPFVVAVNVPEPQPEVAPAFSGPGPFVAEDNESSAGAADSAEASATLEPAPEPQAPAGQLPPPNVLLLPNGRGEIDIPADATPAVSNFTYTEVDVPTSPLGALTFAGLDFTLTVADATTGAAVMTLVDPPRAMIGFRQAELRSLRIRDASTLGLYWWSGTAWVSQLPCTGCGVDLVAGTLTVLLTQVGEYALAAAVPPPPPLFVTPAAISATAGIMFSGAVATFPPLYATDPPSWYNASINWGDNQVSAGFISTDGSGIFTLAGVHTWSASGSYPVVVTVLSGSASRSAQTTAVVASPQTPPAFTAAAPPLMATVGTPYAYTFAASGVPAPTFALAGGAPAWLSIAAATGAVSGTPPAGTTSFTYGVVASNLISPNATAGPFVVAVNAPPAFTAAAPPLMATVGTPYAYTFAASGVPAPTFALAGGAPAWLSIAAATGAVSGTPPAGTTSFTYGVVASNLISPNATAGPFVVAVSPAAGSTADLSVILTAPSTAALGSTIVYAVVVRNAGPASAANPVVFFAAGPDVRIITATPPGVRLTGGLWVWVLPSLPAGQSRTFTLGVVPLRAETLIAGATVFSATRDPVLSNDVASARTTVK